MSRTTTLVAAIGANGVIGAAGGLPWRLPEDLAHFKALTLGHPIIMGRATFESIGRALPGRTTIVITGQTDWRASGVEVAASLDDALLRAAALDDEMFVVGGAQVYAEAVERDLVDAMSITRVAQAPDGDVWFPPVDWSSWREVQRTVHTGFDVVDYERVRDRSDPAPAG